MKVVSRMDREVALNLRMEVLEVLPRTKYVDGVDILSDVKKSIRAKIDLAHRALLRDSGADPTGDIIANLAQEDAFGKLNYDDIMKVLEAPLGEGKVSKKDNGSLPTFQRID